MSEDQVTTIGGTDEVLKMQKYSDEQIIKTFIIKESEKGSQQLLLDDPFKDMYESNEVIEPLYNPLLWASLMEKNTRLAKLIRTYARNTVGLGWGIYPKKPITKDTKKSEKKQIETETELLNEIFESPNDELPFTEIAYQAKVDEESTGNGYMEVSRNMKGEIDGIFHIPSHTMRILKNLKGFVQIRGGSKRYFKKFGQKEEVDFETGKWGASVPFNRRGNEIIHFRIYTPRDSFYGVPRYVAAADAIAGNKMAARRNLAFFKNDATPRMAITVENGKLDGKSINEIRSFVNTEGKGPENAHRVMILQAQQKQQGGIDQKDVKINVIPLTVGQTDDASHIKYRSANDEELREAFGIAEVFIGAKGTVNRSTAAVSRAITNDQEFIPDAQVKEYKINQTICKAFGVKMVKFEFERPNSFDEVDRSEIFARYLQGGGITPNDIRHELGKDEYDYEWADMPMAMALIQYQMQVLGDQGAVSQGGQADNNGKQPKDGKNNGDNNSNNGDGSSGDNNNSGENNGGNQNNSDNNSNDSNGDNNKSNNQAKVKAIVESVQKMLDENIQSMLINLDSIKHEEEEQ
jgi:PBSX family phage portal protein